MNFIIKTFVIIAFITTSTNLVAQDQIIKTHTYSFKNAESKEVVNRLQTELQQSEFVTDVKIRYSEEKKAGMLIITTIEKPVVNEGDRVFSPSVLKQALYKYDITPIAYRLVSPEYK